MLNEQQALVLALLGRGEAPAELCGLRGSHSDRERGLAAYRNNLRALSAQALGGPFSRLRELLGDDDFAAMAWSFWREQPPERGDLAHWGSALADWLQARAGAESGLPGLARLEWALHQAERAAEVVLDTASLQRLADTEPARLGLRLRPGVALLHLEPAAWAHLGEPEQAACALVWREGWRAQWQRLDAGDAELTAVLLQGGSLESALQAASAALQGMGAAGDYELTGWLTQALSKTWLQSAHVIDPR